MALLKKLDIRQPAGGVATNEEQALKIANEVRRAAVGGGGVGGGRWALQG